MNLVSLGRVPRRMMTRPSGPKRWLPVFLAFSLSWMKLQRATAAEGQVGYRYESYEEDQDRIKVRTHAAMFDVPLKPDVLAVKGELVYDSISGATPLGYAPAYKYHYVTAADMGLPQAVFDTLGLPAGDTNKTTVPLQELHDRRRAISLELPITVGPNQFRPQLAFSEESDYISRGFGLNYSLALNEKNTTLNLGWSHSADQSHDDFARWQSRDTDDFLVGVNQLLGPKTVLSANFTFGRAHGYLADPYRRIIAANEVTYIAEEPFPYPEVRPRHRERYIAHLALTQYVTPLHASFEPSYRFFHDSYGVNAHTVELAWHQKIGSRVVLSPLFRYYWQNAADFYYEMLPDVNNKPAYFSSDYRLSEMQSFTYGVGLAIKATDWATIDLGYKRYIMEGLDGVTAQSNYPSANVFTVGSRISF